MPGRRGAPIVAGQELRLTSGTPQGKRSVAIDVNTPEGRDLAERVVADADVFLTNMRPAFLERVGLGHDRLLETYPRLVYASLTGYGLTGPDRDAPGFDVAAFAARGGVSDRVHSTVQPRSLVNIR